MREEDDDGDDEKKESASISPWQAAKKAPEEETELQIKKRGREERGGSRKLQNGPCTALCLKELPTKLL